MLHVTRGYKGWTSARVNRMGVNLDNRVIGSRIFIFGGTFYLLYPLLLGSLGYLLFAAKYLNNTGLRLR